MTYMFTAEELDILSSSLVKNELLKKGSDLYYNFRKSMKKNKQSKTDILAKLCLKLITEKTTLDPTLKSDFMDEFITIMNSFPGKTYQDITVIMKNKWHAERENLREQNKLRYEYQQSNEELKKNISELRSQIFALENQISRMNNPTNDKIYD